MKKLFIVALLALVFSLPTQAQVAFDAVADSETTGFAEDQTSIPDFTLTLGSISNGAVVVALGCRSANPTGVTITVGGNTATEISGTEISQESLIYSVMFGLATGSDTGAQTISISWTGGRACVTGATSFSGVDQSTPFQNGTSIGYAFSDTTASLTITSATGNMTLDIVTNRDGTLPSSPNQTSRWTENTGGGMAGGGSTAIGAASNDHDWTINGVRGTSSGVDIRAVAAGGVEITGPIAITGPVIVQ